MNLKSILKKLAEVGLKILLKSHILYTQKLRVSGPVMIRQEQ